MICSLINMFINVLPSVNNHILLNEILYLSCLQPFKQTGENSLSLNFVYDVNPIATLQK